MPANVAANTSASGRVTSAAAGAVDFVGGVAKVGAVYLRAPAEGNGVRARIILAPILLESPTNPIRSSNGQARRPA
jgi:hypothetical protein